MTRHSYQQGYISEPVRTRQDIAYRIRYRLRDAQGKWTHKSETLHGLAGKKAARAVLDQRIRESENKTVEITDLTVLDFVQAYWRPYLERKQVKPSTKRSYESALKLYPVLDRLSIPRASRAAGFHTFRHSAATIVNQQTGNLKLAQKLLGHSNLSTTADVYTHTSPEAERSAAHAIEQAIYGNLFQSVPQIGNRNCSEAPN